MLPHVTLESAVPGIQRVCQRNAIGLAYLFGSVARGNADEESDIDIGLILPRRQSKTTIDDLHLSLVAAFDMKDELINASEERRLAIERRLEIAIQAVVDTGRLLVALEEWDDEEDSFACLARNGVIEKSLVPRLRKAKDFRPFLAHDYEKSIRDVYVDTCTEDLVDLQPIRQCCGTVAAQADGHCRVMSSRSRGLCRDSRGVWLPRLGP